jgi:uncharacterized protein (TIGR03067 family)
MRLLVVLAAGVLVGAAEPAGDAGKKDSEKLQGTWQYVSFESNGEKMAADQLKKMTVTYTGDKWVVREGDKVVVAGTQKLDPTKEPHEIDSVVTEGEGKGNTMLGIYELKGDTFRVCFDPEGKDRPKDFTPKAGQFGGVVSRVKK